jgi:signal transduction histidine kinase
MRRLYLRIYLAVLASLVVFALAAGVLWHTLADPHGGDEVAAGLPQPRRGPAFGLYALALVLVAVGVGAYPVARRLTQRLERLQHGVEALGSGQLSARVKVEGRDEVARLAESFNRAAARIEELLAAHKSLLANASHELRTPLARIRMALELGKDKREIERDIAELDALIDEVLLASRLDTVSSLDVIEELDLLALAAEEAARYELEAQGEPLVVRGDPRLLRRMIRNLLENARRHGAPPIEVRVQGRELRVCDSGTGVPPAERERIFEPFYSKRGTGLGLALVRQIARRHGGEARCLGNCFLVELPQRA